MSIWADIHKRSNGEAVRKEDIIPITIKVTGKSIFYGKVETKFLFDCPEANEQRNKWFIVADHYLTKEEISEICLNNGVDILNMTHDNWDNNSYWKKLWDYALDTRKQAEESYDGRIVETHSFKKTDDNCYLISIRLNWGNGAYRTFNLPIDLDIKEYRKEVGYPITIADYIDGEVETLLDSEYWNGEFKFKWNMTQEEWDNDDNFSQILSYVRDQRKRLKYEGYFF